MLRFAIAIWLSLAAASAGGAETIAGQVRVTDADTLRVGGTKVRLHGIDAPELGQGCELAGGRVGICGRWASDQVAARYEGAWAVCTRRDTDRYGRAVAVCRVDGADIGARLVRAGLAEAYRKYSLDYVEVESAAASEGLGLWRGRIQSPAEFRAARAGDAPEGCAIKGNISDRGRIYHVPGQAFYAATRIRAAKGERWFCSERQARAAGWRRARG